MAWFRTSPHRFVALAAGTVAVGVLLAALLRPLAWLTPYAALALAAAYAIWMLGLLALIAWQVPVAPSRRPALLTLGALSSYVVSMWFGAHVLIEAGARFYFDIRLRPRYEAILATLDEDQPGRGRRFETMDGIGVAIDTGPPRRVAFVQHHFFGNWIGIIHDPSGEVQQAKGFSDAGPGRREFSAPPHIRTLFGGDMVSYWHVSGPWYNCTFT